LVLDTAHTFPPIFFSYNLNGKKEKKKRKKEKEILKLMRKEMISFGPT